MSTYEKVKEWRAKNKDKVLEQSRRYRKKHPETEKRAKARYREKNLEKIREADKVAQAKRRKADPEGQRIRYERYIIKREQRLWDIAGRPRATSCEICHVSEITVFDHCHKSGKFRGWICDRCNKTLGLFKDDIELIKKFIIYLEKSKNGEVNNESEKEVAIK